MIAVAIAGLVVAAGAVAAAVYFGRAALEAWKGQVAAVGIVRASETAMRDAADAARDALAAQKTAEVGEVEAIRRMESAQARARHVEGVLRAHVRQTVVGGSDDDLGSLVERLLAGDMPVKSGDAIPAARSSDGTTTAPMRAPTGAGAGHEFLDSVFISGGQ
jgi:hypothetical protein